MLGSEFQIGNSGEDEQHTTCQCRHNEKVPGDEFLDHAGSDDAATDVKGDFLVDDRFAGMGEGQVGARPLYDLGHCGR